MRSAIASGSDIRATIEDRIFAEAKDAVSESVMPRGYGKLAISASN
jgi:hypothetical protein